MQSCLFTQYVPRSIVLCCKALHDLFAVAHEKAAGADELLPMLIYTIIVAAPHNLYATTQYIDRFLPGETLSSGETAYNFTNMCCAIQFLEDVSPEKLSLSSQVHLLKIVLVRYTLSSQVHLLKIVLVRYIILGGWQVTTRGWAVNFVQ